MMKKMKEDARKRSTATEYLHHKAQKSNLNYINNNDNQNTKQHSKRNIDKNHDGDNNDDNNDGDSDERVDGGNDNDDHDHDHHGLNKSVHIPWHVNSQYSSSSIDTEDHDKHTDLLTTTTSVVKGITNKSNKNINKSNKLNTTSSMMMVDKDDILNIIQTFDFSTNMDIMKINNDIMKLKASLSQQHHHHNHHHDVAENNRVMKTSVSSRINNHDNNAL